MVSATADAVKEQLVLLVHILNEGLRDGSNLSHLLRVFFYVHELVSQAFSTRNRPLVRSVPGEYFRSN